MRPSRNRHGITAKSPFFLDAVHFARRFTPVSYTHLTKASETYKFTVRGIYEYTGETPAGYGSDAKYAKDNRENVVYTLSLIHI